jgi:hypothetical protein
MNQQRRRRGRGESGAVLRPYVDYFDAYYDYTDYGDYPDTYADSSGTYKDYGDYKDAGRPSDDPRTDWLVQKVVILEGDFSYLLAGDPDINSSLFESLKKDSKGRLVGVFPLLLNQGWQIAKMMPPDPAGRITVLMQRREARASRRTSASSPQARPSSSSRSDAPSSPSPQDA